jgi:hypothetical protein
MAAILKISNSYSLGNPITWELLNMADHVPIYIDTVIARTSIGITVKYPRTKAVFNMSMLGDNGLAATGVLCGASVGLDSSDFTVTRAIKQGVRLQGAGTNTWTLSGSTGYILVDTFNRATGVTRFNRTPYSGPSDAWAENQYQSRLAAPAYQSTDDSIHYLSRVTTGLAPFAEAFKILKSNGQPLIAELPLSTDYVYLDLGVQNVSVPLQTWATTNQFLNSTYVFWLYGLFESYIIVTPTTSTSNVIKFQEYTAATQYKIYRATSKYGSRTLIDTVTDDGSATHTITDNTASTGTFYYYFMVATIASVDTDITYFTCRTK